MAAREISEAKFSWMNRMVCRIPLEYSGLKV